MKNVKTAYEKHGILFRLLYLIIAVLYWIFTGFGLLYRNKMIVLCYHGINNQQSRLFSFQMRRIASRTIGITNSIENRSKFSCLPLVCITFDDAFENLLLYAIPVLDELQIPAVIFAVFENSGETPQWEMSSNHPEANEKTMTLKQLENLSKNTLIRIGSHTNTHPDLVTIPSANILAELIDSKSKLESLLQYSIENLALPHGSYNKTVLTIAEQVGYKRIYTLAPKINSIGTKKTIINRFSMSPDVWSIEFYLTCAGAYAWLYYFRLLVNQIRHIIK